MQITAQMEAAYAVAQWDTIQSKNSGFTAIVISVQEFDYGFVYECLRTDNGATALLLRTEFTLVEKHVPSTFNPENYRLSQEMADRTRNWREAA